MPAGAGGNDTVEPALLRHLIQQWSNSGRPLTALVQELQTRAGMLLQPDSDALTQQQAAANYLDRLVQQSDALQSVNQQATQLIQSQLHTLEQQRFVWQGELWPGQRMEWEVNKDKGGQSSAGDPEQQAWQSTVRFRFPMLGTVSAIMVKTDDAETAALLRAHGGELAQALNDAGSPLDSLIVNDDGQA
jgi:hypothetical protein